MMITVAIWNSSYVVFLFQVMLAPLIEIALNISNLKALIGRDLPTVVT